MLDITKYHYVVCIHDAVGVAQLLVMQCVRDYNIVSRNATQYNMCVYVQQLRDQYTLDLTRIN